MVLAGFQASQLTGPDPDPVVGMHAGAKQGVGGRHFADLEAEHAVNRVRPVEPIGVDIPVPGADSGEILAAFEAFGVAVLMDVLSFGQVGDEHAIFVELLSQRTLATDQRDNQGKQQRANGCAGPDMNHAEVAVMAF
ncbi:hypothetical protein D3C84_569760 [compost metagenome]